MSDEVFLNEGDDATQMAPPPRKRLGGILLAVALLAVAGVGVWLWLRSRAVETPQPVVTAPPPPPAVEAPPEPPPVSLAEGEALLRKLGADLSSVKELAGWLSQQDILRRLVAAVNLTADGKSPAAVLSFLKPRHGFEVVHKKKHVFISPRSGSGYTVVTRVLGTVDPAAAAKAYVQIRPFADAAYAEIGPKGKKFDARLGEALAAVAATPIPQAPTELVTQ